MSIRKTIFATAAAVVLASAAAHAQQTVDVTGSVTDAQTGKPLAGAVVKIVDADGRLVRYAVSDGEGRFAIKRAVPAAGCRLDFSMLGYAPYVTAPADWSRPVLAPLAPKATQIREVVVKAPTISMQGDTISYNAKAFTDVKDKTLADILKKMPGIEVSKSGQVKYQGESINKLYLDGADMFGDRYGIATKNISPRDVKSVDVMENHQPKKILRDLEFSEKAALNIRLEDRVKNTWSGSAEAGGGFSPALWSGSLFAMCIGGKLSSVNSAKSDDTGRTIGDETAFTGTGGSGYTLPQYVSVGTSAAPIGAERTRFNTSHLYNTANTLRLTEDYNLYVNASYLYERLTSENSSSTTYYVGDRTITTRSLADAADASHTLNASARLLANTDRTYLDNVLSAEITWRDTWCDTDGTYPNRQSASTPSQRITDRIEVIKRFGRRTLSVRSSNAYLRTPQELEVERDEQTQRQEVDAWAFHSATETSYAWNPGRFRISLNGSFTQLVRALESHLYGLADIVADDRNDMRLSMSQAELYPSFSYDAPSLKLSLRIPAAYRFYSIRDRIKAAGTRRVDDLTFAPSLSAKFFATPMLSLSASASYTVSPINESNIRSGAILTDYRYISRGYEIFDNDTSASASARAEYRNPLASLFANVSAGYTFSRLHAVSSQDFTGDYIVTSAVAQPYDTRTFYVRGGASKGIDAVKGKIGADVSWNSSHVGMVQDGEYNPYLSQTLTVSPSFHLRILRGWTAEYALAYTLSTLEVEITGMRSSTSTLSHSLATSVSPAKAFRIDLAGEHYRTQISDGNHKHTLLLDAAAAYTFKNGWELSLSARNLLDRKEYAYTLFDGLSSSSARFAIRPRNILLRLYVKF